MFLYILEGLVLILVMTVMITQVIIPLWVGLPLFPRLRASPPPPATNSPRKTITITYDDRATPSNPTHKEDP